MKANLDNTIIAVSCGLTSPKKDYDAINKRNLYLNYGLLGLCSLLYRRGYKIRQYQGEYLQPAELVRLVNQEHDLNNISYPILISIISFHSIEWCNDFSKIIKTKYGLKCIVGGKYVVDGNVNWLKEKLPYVDQYLEGDGEETIESIVNPISSGCTINNTVRNISYPYKELLFPLLYQYKKYNPCIELARGCGRGCVFCADGNRTPSIIKPAQNVVSELIKISRMYEDEPFSAYYQMATFNASQEWIELYNKELIKKFHPIPWRCTSRVDVLPVSSLKTLSKAGLKVIDLGLESASEVQLLKMQKTKTPCKYLKAASDLLREAYDCGIWIKLNILLSAGETEETITETIQWLEFYKKYIKGVSVNIETIYGPHTNIDYFKSLGASLTDQQELQTKGFAILNVSQSIDYEKAKKYSLIISKIIMDERDYFDLKKIGYFPRHYTYYDFRKDLDKCDQEKLPFMIKAEE